MRLATLARQAAVRLAPERDPIDRSGRLPPSLAAIDWVALATAEMGNAYRVIGELDTAERCLRQALSLVPRGGGDARLAATIADLAASLLADQRRFPAAAAILERLHEIYQRLGDRPLGARTLLGLSVVHSYAGSTELALPMLLRAIAQLDPAGEPQLVALALHNLSKLLLDLGRPRAAERVLSSAERAAKLSSAPLDRLRRRWLAGRIAAALGSAEVGVAALRQAMEGFAALGLVYPATLAALDLASLQVRLGRRGEARDLLAGAIGIFRRLGIAREGLASLLLLGRLLATAAVSNEALIAGIESTAMRLAELAAKAPRRPPAR